MTKHATVTNKRKLIGFKTRHGKRQKWYGSRCRICGTASPPLPLKLVANWARQHNYEHHQGLKIVRRNRKTKLQQRFYWTVAKRALYQLDHHPMRYVTGRSVSIQCRLPNCNIMSKYLNESEVKAWMWQHRLQIHSATSQNSS